MKDLTREIFLLAELLQELKKRGHKENYPQSYQYAMEMFDERIAQLNEEIKKIKEEENV